MCVASTKAANSVSTIKSFVPLLYVFSCLLHTAIQKPLSGRVYSLDLAVCRSANTRMLAAFSQFVVLLPFSSWAMSVNDYIFTKTTSTQFAAFFISWSLVIFLFGFGANRLLSTNSVVWEKRSRKTGIHFYIVRTDPTKMCQSSLNKFVSIKKNYPIYRQLLYNKQFCNLVQRFLFNIALKCTIIDIAAKWIRRKRKAKQRFVTWTIK